MSEGQLITVIGATRMGKSSRVRSEIQKAKRVLIWDVKRDTKQPCGEWGAWPEFNAVSTWEHLGQCLRTPDGQYSSEPGRYAFHPAAADKQSFAIFAAAAHRWVMAGDAVIIAEELPDVTSAGKGESAWGRLCRQGVGQGATIYAITQRPAESDKSSLGGSQRVIVHRVGLDIDREYAGQLLQAPKDLIKTPLAELKPLEYIERRPDDSIVAGKYAFAPSTGMLYLKGRARIIRKKP